MKNKITTYLFICYFLANAFMLINNGIFWDDWTIIGMERLGLLQQFGENGFWILIYLHDFLNDGTYAPLLYHWLSFALLFGAYLFFFKVLMQFRLSANRACGITMLAMLAPYFEAKNTVVCMPYALFFFLLFLGMFMIFSFLENKTDYIRLWIGIVSLFLSFFLNSVLLVFLFAIALFFLTRNHFSIAQIKRNDLKSIALYIGFCAIPFVFWVFKQIFFPVKGLYASRGYNIINFSFEKLPKQYVNIISDNIFGVYMEFINVFKESLWFAIPVFIICLAFSLYCVKRMSFLKEKNGGLLALAFVGLLLFIICTYPYTVVNKLPSYVGFSTRHQILLPLGISFVLYALIHSLPHLVRKGALIFFIGAFMTITVKANANFLRGWIKQEAIGLELKQLNIDMGGVVFSEGFDGKYNATERPLSFYVLNGIIKKNLKRQDIFLIPKKEYTRMAKSLPGIYSHAIKFNMKDIENKLSGDKMIKITYKDENFDFFNVLRCAVLYFFDQDSFNKSIKDFITIKYE